MITQNGQLMPIDYQNDKTKSANVNQKKTGGNDNVRVKVGVGGLFIIDVFIDRKKIKCAILYKRPHDPEKNQWSLPGGSVPIFKSCEETLILKVANRLSLTDARIIEIQDVIVAVNHYNREKNYHYVSPQYYINIREFTSLFYFTHDLKEQGEGEKSPIIILDTKKKLINSIKDTENTLNKKPLLCAVPINLIYEMDKYNHEECDKIFIKTTIEAVRAHCVMQESIDKISKNLYKYRTWRKYNRGTI